jgi:hypothetical protein
MVPGPIPGPRRWQLVSPITFGQSQRSWRSLTHDVRVGLAHKGMWVVFVGVIMACLTACNESSTGSSPPTRPPTAAPTPITVSTGDLCQVQAHIYSFPLRVEDNGRRYRMGRCQTVDVLLLHAASDGCSWSTVQTSDSSVVAIVPVPLPPPPRGGTHEIYRATSPGHAYLTSSLCPNGPRSRVWSVTIDVTP